MKRISFVLSDTDWKYLHDDFGDEFSYDFVEDARNNKEQASIQLEIPESDIIILKETIEEVV
jgi:hypothetical protein